MGNERVYQLTDSAVMEEVQALDWADIISAETEAGQTKDFTNNCASPLLSRIKELGLKVGVVKNEQSSRAPGGWSANNEQL